MHKATLFAISLALLGVGTGCVAGATPGPTVTVTVTASPSTASLAEAKATLGPLLKARDEAVERLNEDQNSDSVAVKRSAARQLATADNDLLHALVEQEWPPTIAKEVDKLIAALHREEPVVEEMGKKSTDADEFYNLIVDNLLKDAVTISAAQNALELKLGID